MRFYLLIFFSILFFFANAQSISDNEFKWAKTDNCGTVKESTEIYLKVEKDPKIIQQDETEFRKSISEAVKNLAFNESEKGTLKLKLLFQINKPICVKEIGFKNIVMNQTQIESLSRIFNLITDIEYGQQRNISKNCLGLLYLEINEGKLVSLRNVNFEI
jgi:hypothetical protein